MAALSRTAGRRRRRPSEDLSRSDGYFRIRDFEYVQPLYDLAFLLEIDAISKGIEPPKYRTFSLWRAGLSLDSYGTTIDRWLDGELSAVDLDYVPSLRIREYLTHVRRTGSIPELAAFRNTKFDRCLRLRSVRGLGPAKIALSLTLRSVTDDWLSQIGADLSASHARIARLFDGPNLGPWQTAHVVPPMLRFLEELGSVQGKPMVWGLSGIEDPFEAITGAVSVWSDASWDDILDGVAQALTSQRLFSRDLRYRGEGVRVRHQMGWTFLFKKTPEAGRLQTTTEMARWLDPFASPSTFVLKSDLHLHTAWSDGSASVNTMAAAAADSGLTHFAVTDHSRSSKLQGGLTPALWLRQANALTLAAPVCPVLHGTEVDILKDGTLDLPSSILAAADLVVASVHSNWTSSLRVNTDRLVRAIESGRVDILAHPTSAVVGKPGVPDYRREPAEVDWTEVFDTCARWRVAVELNCFPSRLDLPLSLLRDAVNRGCAISLGSDAHARSHLINLRFGEAALARFKASVVLNMFSYDELLDWIKTSREVRSHLTQRSTNLTQAQFNFGELARRGAAPFRARIQPPQRIPAGSKIVGIDLTAGNKATGVSVLDGYSVETKSLTTDEEILEFVHAHRPAIVSIDSPLGLPGGGDAIDPRAGIVRVAENDLASVGIPAYPALIDSMKNLTLRGIRLRKILENLESPPTVIESYPGAAQDILCIPRKQKSLGLLREGLGRLGITGTGLATRSHDEMDAITSAIVGRYFESGQFEPMGIPSEAQLIVPKVSPLRFDQNPVICLSGKTGAGKSVVARYLSVFYGFHWIRTRSVIRELLLDDIARGADRWYKEYVDPEAITEAQLRNFGALILDVYQQAPLRRKLNDIFARIKAPIVVDSIRDVVDVERANLGQRPVVIWFVDCPDNIIRQRLTKKRKLGEKRIPAASPVDRTASAISREADKLVSNSKSLEDLRWQVDDLLFSSMDLTRN